MSEDQFAPITSNYAGLQKKSVSSSLEQVEFLVSNFSCSLAQWASTQASYLVSIKQTKISLQLTLEPLS